ncbi:hypothetical protein C8034_v006344 [Colletotrichum sidae]|uniref:TauD/TfdA-like domain-containing protein n=1 Tax=Colletotrichum sidae TaxID=1347389 RepID=A0A4R8TTD4_9PEZI|nr:hypothetical protein C8034_v006344 [Colletotrichum sidae]
MQAAFRHTRGSLAVQLPGILAERAYSTLASSKGDHLGTDAVVHKVPHLIAPTLDFSQNRLHIDQVAGNLDRVGILKVTLEFPDHDSEYLQRLILNLHKHHGHELPISHSSTRGWFWDVRPSENEFQAGAHQARSETMQDFPWHTDCSYENPPPRYFALQVLQHDRFGGGTLSVLNVERMIRYLSPSTRTALETPEYRISIPAEFIKDESHERITASILAIGHEASIMRFREDILVPLTGLARKALEELSAVLASEDVRADATLHLTPDDLPTGSIILMDNRRWLHARNRINDPKRHLRRVRWDTCVFGNGEKCKD